MTVTSPAPPTHPKKEKVNRWLLIVKDIKQLSLELFEARNVEYLKIYIRESRVW